ncbi:MAG TPA: class I SAM-dependent methyltransferase [Thermoanaerobaculia bacterium]|nr:class I SAM-dependent methyltransferase [Thermoanaerobaculia bacterium]
MSSAEERTAREPASGKATEIWQFRPWRAKGHLRHFWDQLFLLDAWRTAVVAVRYLWFARLRRRLRLHQAADDGVAPKTVEHNLRGLRDFGAARTNALLRPLSMIERIPQDARILSVGPRSEGELFGLAAHGFHLRNVRGIDLISYSPRVDLGDVHRLPYPDGSFDAVVCGWVLAYSDRKRRAAEEIVRVCRRGGVVAVAVEHRPASVEAVAAELGYVPGSSERIIDLEGLLALFRPAVDEVLFAQQPGEARSHRLASIVAIFSTAGS